MPIVTYVGKDAGALKVEEILRGAGFEVTRQFGGSIQIGTPANTVVGFAVTNGAEGGATSPVTVDHVLQLLDERHDQDEFKCLYLFVNDRRAKKIEWDHDGDQCVAEVGKPFKWRKYLKTPGQFGPWTLGRMVWAIEPEPRYWHVYLDPFGPRDGWVDNISCGDGFRVEVAYFA
jgi:hypothetical protein